MLHPIRRFLTRMRLRRTDMPQSLLFICRGNVCRSPYAAAVFARSAPESANVRISSAGFVPGTRIPPSAAVHAAAARGVDLSGHRSVLVSQELIEEADLVVLVEPFHEEILRRCYPALKPRTLVLGDLDPDSDGLRSIVDPIHQPLSVYEASYGKIDRCIAELVRVFSRAEG